MNRSVLNAACAFAALFLLATAAHGAYSDSPKVTGAANKQVQERLLKACPDAGAKVHNICDGVPTCIQNDTKAILQGNVKNAQNCTDARRQITREWWAGNSDAGQGTAAEGKVNQANNCVVLLSRK